MMPEKPTRRHSKVGVLLYIPTLLVVLQQYQSLCKEAF